ncbi:DNA-binding protein [Desulfitobacterium metallireducens DSM 15288]|uniref:DNA-binding protein n=1 Tax=Desulfitobacterium metallireducens DSM 15288 TaxID=871968 RepID=W0E939_9FIRM|nr:DNA-binding protein [Desulfitobacterium metallireducens DSM 15288]
MTFAEKLHMLRKSKNMSQEQLAAQITVSRQAISKWELGESLPDTDNIIQLSKVFGVSIDYLLNDKFQSDNDIPAVKENNIYHKKVLQITAIIIGSIGAVGILLLWILSTMIKVHVTKSQVMPDGTKTYYGGGDVLGYNFWAFISEYRLMAIFWILSVFLIFGLALLLIRFKNMVRKQ